MSDQNRNNPSNPNQGQGGNQGGNRKEQEQRQGGQQGGQQGQGGSSRTGGTNTDRR